MTFLFMQNHEKHNLTHKRAQMNTPDKINYLEFPTTNIDGSKHFFNTLFGWQFTDYGPDYSAFSDDNIDGGFYHSEQVSSQDKGSVLVVFYSDDLEQLQQRVEAAGGHILKSIFTFPGGRRFHFSDPSGNEFAIWSDK